VCFHRRDAPTILHLWQDSHGRAPSATPEWLIAVD
jgi:hypothetical protein